MRPMSLANLHVLADQKISHPKQSHLNSLQYFQVGILKKEIKQDNTLLKKLDANGETPLHFILSQMNAIQNNPDTNTIDEFRKLGALAGDLINTYSSKIEIFQTDAKR